MAEPGRDDVDVIERFLMRVYEIHEWVSPRGSSGLEGIRDAAWLHAAMARPFATFGEIGLYPTDFDKTAALFHSLMAKANELTSRTLLEVIHVFFQEHF